MSLKSLLIIAVIVIIFLFTEVFLSTITNTNVTLEHPPRVQHIWLIIEENHSAGQVYGNLSSAPYINALGRQYVELRGYLNLIQQAPLNVPSYLVHPSLPNYLALTSGTTWWVTNDCTVCFFSVYSGITPVNTTLNDIEGGKFMPALNRQGQNGTSVIVRNLKVLAVEHSGDGDITFDATDGTYPKVHMEITPPFQAFVKDPTVGATIKVVGTPFCDRQEGNMSWHSPNANGKGTCWEVHPVTCWYLVGTPPCANSNLFSDTQDHGLSWRMFEESMTSRCDRSDFGDYVARHNPAIFYANLASGSCLSYDLGLNSSDLPTPSVNFTWITPNICDDMHSCSITTADNYLSNIVPKIMATQDYKSGVILIVWDETGIRTDNRLPAIVISPLVKHGYVSSLSYDHYSVLHTIEYMLGLPDLGRNDVVAPLITDIWN